MNLKKKIFTSNPVMSQYFFCGLIEGGASILESKIKLIIKYKRN